MDHGAAIHTGGPPLPAAQPLLRTTPRAMPAHDSEYTPLAQDDVEKVPDSLARDYRPAASLSVWTVLLVMLVVAINIACMATTWNRVEKVYAGLHERLDFRDTRDLWRPNTNSYFGE